MVGRAHARRLEHDKSLLAGATDLYAARLLHRPSTVNLSGVQQV